MSDHFKKTRIEEFTRQEFLDFVTKLGDPTGRNEAEDDKWISHFSDLVRPDPRGTDILFYPAPGKDSEEAMVEEVETYRRDNGLPGFKDSDF